MNHSFLCVFKGNRGPVISFIDHGCNFWLAEEGVPESELVSCKLRDGPIPMGVTSGVTVDAAAEWAALLSLADGGHQIVQELMVPRDTSHMPSPNLTKVYNSLKNKMKGNKTIQSMKIPSFRRARPQEYLSRVSAYV